MATPSSAARSLIQRSMRSRVRAGNWRATPPAAVTASRQEAGRGRCPGARRDEVGEGQGIARRDRGQEAEQAVARGGLAEDRARLADHRERPATEQRRGPDPGDGLVQEPGAALAAAVPLVAGVVAPSSSDGERQISSGSSGSPPACVASPATARSIVEGVLAPEVGEARGGERGRRRGSWPAADDRASLAGARVMAARPQRRRRNGLRRDAGRLADLALEPIGSLAGARQRSLQLGMAALPAEEAPAHGLEALRGALVRVGHDPGFTAGAGGEGHVLGVVAETRDRVERDGLRELRIPVLGEPSSAGLPMGLVPARIGLVDVVEEGRGLHEVAVDRGAAALGPLGKECGDLRDRRHVSQQARRRFQTEEHLAGFVAGWDGHRSDRSKGNARRPGRGGSLRTGRRENAAVP